MASRRARLGGLLAVALVLLTAGASAAARRVQTGAALISTPGPIPLQLWQGNTDNLIPVTGHVTLGGAPVEGVYLNVGDFELPSPTGADGQFVYLADGTRLARYLVTVADDSQARVHGAALSATAQKQLSTQSAAITIAYPISKLSLGHNAKGDPTVRGQITFSDRRTAPPTVSLYSYQLTGTVLDPSGHPVSGALVSTRTPDRDYWTVSTPTDSAGTFSSLYSASDESGDNPVPLTVKVAIGNTVYQDLPFEFVRFPALRSARLIIHLPPTNYALALPLPVSYPGAIYQGVVVGVAEGDGAAIVRPLAVSWPDATGRFAITLPRTLTGDTVTLWESPMQLFSVTPGTAGGPITITALPASLAPSAARAVTTIHLP